MYQLHRVLSWSWEPHFRSFSTLDPGKGVHWKGYEYVYNQIITKQQIDSPESQSFISTIIPLGFWGHMITRGRSSRRWSWGMYTWWRGSRTIWAPSHRKLLPIVLVLSYVTGTRCRGLSRCWFSACWFNGCWCRGQYWGWRWRNAGTNAFLLQPNVKIDKVIESFITKFVG